MTLSSKPVLPAFSGRLIMTSIKDRFYGTPLNSLTQPQAASGKTTFRRMLSELLNERRFDVEPHSFAEPIKACVYNFLRYTGMPLADVNEAIYGSRKEAMIPFLASLRGIFSRPSGPSGGGVTWEIMSGYALPCSVSTNA